MKILLVLFSLVPLAIAYYRLSSAIDPIKMLYTYTGIGAIVLLLLSLLPSTLRRLFKLNLLPYRKTLGLLSFVYTTLHLAVFIVFDSEFDWVSIVEKSLKKPFIYIGFIAFITFLAMALTSTKKLFARFAKYHKVVYIALISGLIHSTMAQKVAGIDRKSVV